MRGITAALAALGCEVRVHGACRGDGRGVLEDPAVPWDEAGVAAWPRAPRALAWLRELRTARKVARRALDHPGGADLVIERHSLGSNAGRKVADGLGAPLALELNAPQILERVRAGEPPPALARRWERRTLRSADRVFAVSRWLVDWAVAEQGCDPGRVQLLRNGVAGLSGDRARGRARLGLPEEAWLLGFLGSFRPWHGLPLLPGLLDALPEARLLLVGDGDPALLGALRGHPRVLLAGRQPQPAVADLVAAMDLGLAPYPADAPPWFCPLKILDYLAQGTPVLASDHGDCRELVGPGGAVVPPGDLAALAEAARAWRGRRCAPRVRSWQEVAGELLEGLGLRPRSAATPLAEPGGTG